MNYIKRKKILEYAIAHSHYYSTLLRNANLTLPDCEFEAFWRKIPFLDKKTLQFENNRILSDEYGLHPLSDGLEIRRTSGSTGDCLKICWHLKDNMCSMLSLWRLRQKYYSITPIMKCCSFYSASYIGNKIFDPQMSENDSKNRHLAFCKIGLTEQRLLECYNQMMLFAPDWLSLQPSIAVLLSELIVKFSLPKIDTIKYIELNGEFLTDSSRNFIEQCFGVFVTNMYGSIETNAIGIELPNKTMHIVSDNVFVEVIKDGESVIGKEGEICVTSLYNHAMPLIRYLTGDIGVIHSTNTYQRQIEIISGRSCDFIYLSNNQRISSHVLFSLVQYTNEYMSGAIKQYQFQQMSFSKMKLRLSLKPAYASWGSSVIEAFKLHMTDPHLACMEWEFIIDENIYPDENSGKLKSFIPIKTTQGVT